MPLPLHKPPLGLLGALDLKTLGRNPSMLEDGVRPSLELFSAYAASLQTLIKGATPALVSAGSLSIVSVPAGVCWRLRQMEGRVVLAAAATAPDGVAFTLGYGLVSDLSTWIAVESGRFEVPVAGLTAQAGFVISHEFAQPVFLPPGGMLIIQLDADLAAPSVQAGLRAVVEVLPL